MSLVDIFADLPDDLEHQPLVTVKAERAKLHPFEQSGLGVSPFRCMGVTDLGTASGSCKFCGHGIRYAFHVQSADGVKFDVGSDCVEKTGAEVANFGQTQKAWKKALSQKQSQARKARELTKVANAIVEFRSAHQAECKWLDANCMRDSFARSLNDWLCKKGYLTEGQLGAVTRTILREVDRAQARQVEQTKRAETAPTVDTTQLEAAFTKALGHIRSPKITLGDLTFVPAKATSNNAGAIYVKRGREYEAPYLGKILHGKFFASAQCVGEEQKRVADMVNDPKKTAEAYGVASGKCCLCNRTLTDGESIKRGIGPICAENFGW